MNIDNKFEKLFPFVLLGIALAPYVFLYYMNRTDVVILTALAITNTLMLLAGHAFGKLKRQPSEKVVFDQKEFLDKFPHKNADLFTSKIDDEDLVTLKPKPRKQVKKSLRNYILGKDEPEVEVYYDDEGSQN